MTSHYLDILNNEVVVLNFYFLGIPNLDIFNNFYSKTTPASLGMLMTWLLRNNCL